MKGSTWSEVNRELPRPSPHFRERAWREFQRRLDPLSPPRPHSRHRLEWAKPSVRAGQLVGTDASLPM